MRKKCLVIATRYPLQTYMFSDTLDSRTTLRHIAFMPGADSSWLHRCDIDWNILEPSSYSICDHISSDRHFGPRWRWYRAECLCSAYHYKYIRLPQVSQLHVVSPHKVEVWLCQWCMYRCDRLVHLYRFEDFVQDPTFLECGGGLSTASPAFSRTPIETAIWVSNVANRQRHSKAHR